MEEEHNAIKIAIVGLDNAGKTTMLKTLQKNYHIGDALKPTKNINRKLYRVFGNELTVWDFGGQAQYRKNYLHKPERYLSMIKYLFYVIDVQDQIRFSESLKYFEDIYDFIKDMEQMPLISIFLHKVDPELQHSPKIIERLNHIQNAIHNIAPEHEIAYFQTSCFDPLSVLSALSLPIIGSSKLYNKLSTYFANFGMENGVEYMNAIIDGLFEVGAFRLFRPHQKSFVDASIEFYNQFPQLNLDKPINHFTFKEYNFIVIKGIIESFNYTVNIAYDSNNEDTDLNESKLQEVRTKIEELLVENKIKLY